MDAQQNRTGESGIKHTEELAQIKLKYVYSHEISLDMTRLKTFLLQSTLEKYTELQIQDNNSSNPEAIGTPH